MIWPAIWLPAPWRLSVETAKKRGMGAKLCRLSYLLLFLYGSNEAVDNLLQVAVLAGCQCGNLLLEQRSVCFKNFTTQQIVCADTKCFTDLQHGFRAHRFFAPFPHTRWFAMWDASNLPKSPVSYLIVFFATESAGPFLSKAHSFAILHTVVTFYPL